MENLNNLKKAASLVSKNFEIKEIETVEEDTFLNELHKHLSKEIAYLLDAEFEKLMQIFYRIDLDETKVKEVIFGDSQGSIPDQLTTLVIERQLKKIETWNQYSQ